jgi:outer membrane protein TolC
MSTLPLSLVFSLLPWTMFFAPAAAAPVPAPTAAPAPAAAPPLTVTWQQALDRAFARNPSAVVASQEIARAEALVRQARAGWMPSLTANGSYTRLNEAIYSGPALVDPINQWNANLRLNVPLVSPLAWVNDLHAQDGRAVAVASAADVHRQLGAAVGRAYLTVLLQHRQLDVARSARETAAAHYDYAHTRMVTGLGNGVDDARAEQELRSDEAQLKNAETALVRAQSALAVLLSEETLVDAAEDLSLDTPPGPEAAVVDAQERRADVQALRVRQRATARLVGDEWVYYAPSLLAQAQAYRQTSAPPLLPGSGWQASLILSIPLFEGGLRSGIAREQRAADEEARATLEGMMRQVSVEVRASLEVVHNADDSLGSARAAATAANTAAALADKSYRAGASTNIEVIDAERQARDAASLAALAEDAARQARLDLLLATGAFP